jgi:hypothetical protein
MVAQPRPGSSDRPANFLRLRFSAWHGGRLAMGRRARSDADLAVRLAGRIAELEDRIRALELRVARVSKSSERLSVEKAALRPPVPSASRCPGCLLELPRGRRGASCVWCGFVFAAVRRRAAR